MAIGAKKQLEAIEKAIEKKLGRDGLQEVADLVIDVGRQKVQTEVYNVYEPNPLSEKRYRRTGKLQKNWKTTNYTPLCIGISSDRYDEGSGKYVSNVVETGEGYDFTNSFIPMPYEYPRPFFAETVREVKETKLHVIGYATVLAKVGVKTKPKL